MRTKEEREAYDSYNKSAKHYHEHRTTLYPKGWFFNELLEMPATLELLGNVKGKRLLDFGCGTGIYARLLTKRGARVSGFDISPEMLAIAKRDNPSLKLKLGSGYKIPFKEKFDVVQASLVLHHIKDWDRVFGEVSGVLKKGGIFVFSINNPVTEIAKSTKIKGKTYWLLGKKSYFNEKLFYMKWRMGKKEIFNARIPVYHKTYEAIIKVIIKNGFEIVDYRDGFPIKKAKKLFPERYAFFSKTPIFSVWKLRKSS